MNAQTQSNTPSRASARAARQAGFTLVEIMVVIVILGLLATLVSQNIMGASEESSITKAQTDVKSIADAVKMYYIKNQRLPESIESLTEPDDKGKFYLEQLPEDPWGEPYQLVEGETRRDFEVISCGPDRQEGTEDDISSKSKKDR